VSIKSQIKITIVVLITSILLFAYTPLDFIVQDYFYDTTTHTWILDHNLQPIKFIFYDGIKKLLIIFILLLIVLFVFQNKIPKIKEYRQGILIVILSAIFVPVVVGALKKQTNMPCPKNEIHYGGIYPSTKVWEHYPKTFKQEHKIRCWPAGHASGGFTLLSLFFLFKTRRNKITATIIALVIAYSMAIYKMLIGDHFLSHTIITMLIAWLIILTITLSMRKINEKKPTKI
jgi:membrane-associated PAP2 superfamily phosphatase